VRLIASVLPARPAWTNRFSKARFVPHMG
jgi:hypothetical protein